MRQLEAFAFDAMRRLDIVESEMGVARDFYEQLQAYFGMPKGELESNVFFELLAQFIDHWTKAMVKKQKEVKSQAAAIMAAAAAKKSRRKSSNQSRRKGRERAT